VDRARAAQALVEGGDGEAGTDVGVPGHEDARRGGGVLGVAHPAVLVALDPQRVEQPGPYLASLG
jgi:hypothetical protein